MDVVPVLLGPMWMTSDLRLGSNCDTGCPLFPTKEEAVVGNNRLKISVDDDDEKMFAEVEKFTFHRARRDNTATSALINARDLG